MPKVKQKVDSIVFEGLGRKGGSDAVFPPSAGGDPSGDWGPGEESALSISAMSELIAMKFSVYSSHVSSDGG
jgi:hypothetical protein